MYPPLLYDIICVCVCLCIGVTIIIMSNLNTTTRNDCFKIDYFETKVISDRYLPKCGRSALSIPKKYVLHFIHPGPLTAVLFLIKRSSMGTLSK